MDGNTQNTGDGTPLNPWFSIWNQPRATIQQIIDENPTRMVLVLAALGGIAQSIDRASSRNLGDQFEWPIIILLAVVVGSLSGIVGLYIGGALLRWTGGWIGGEAPAQHIRAAIAWTHIPIIYAMLLWVPALMVAGQETFTTETPRLSANPPLAIMFVALLVLNVVFGIWRAVILLKCLGQVQGFSAWKALGNVLLASAVLAVPILALAWLGSLLTS